MTDIQFISAFAFAVLLGFDLLVIAAQSGLDYGSIQRLLNLSDSNKDKDGQPPRQSPSFITVRTSRAALHWTKVILHFLMAGAALAFFSPWWERGGFSFGVLVAALFVLLLVPWLEWIVGERTAKNADEWATRTSGVARGLAVLLSPVLFLGMRIFPTPAPTEQSIEAAMENELINLVESGQQDGRLEKDERKMIYSIFRLGDTLAREIMIPRIDILALDVETPLNTAVETLLKTGFSRVPVFRETVDNVLGVLYTKDLLRVWQEGSEISSLQSLLRPAYFVPEAKKVDELLAEMQARRVHMAVVVDEYGGVAGVVTLEDIVEEIVGEIQDEYDQAEELPYQQMEDGEYVFQGRVDLDDFNEIMGSYLPSEEADTIGGFIYNRIGRVPTTGESVQINNLLLTVEQVTGRRIRKIKASWLPVEVEEKKEESNVDR